MKHSTSAQFALLAVLGAAATTASAQSSVALYGLIDATFMVGHGSTANKTQLGNSGNTTSRLGFRGTEDLGGGLKAGFVLEMGLNNDDGTGATTNPNNQGTYKASTGRFTANASGGGGTTFNRRSMLTLSNTMGELRLGRDYTPHYWQYVFFDPFTMNGVGASQIYAGSLGGPTLVRASNSIGYVLPGNLGGLYGQAQVYLGENTGTEAAPIGKSDGNGVSLRLGWASGPWNMAVAMGRTQFALPGDITTSNAGLSYDFGRFKLSAMVNSDKVGSAAKSSGYLVGVSVPTASGELRATYSGSKAKVNGTSPEADKVSLGYVHNLSKRTAVYGTVAYLSNKGGATFGLNGATTAANTSSKGLDIGIRHAF